MRSAILSATVLLLSATATAQTPTAAVARAEITPGKIDAEVGQTLTFTAAAFDESGKRLDLKATAWFAAPFDAARIWSLRQHGAGLHQAPSPMTRHARTFSTAVRLADRAASPSPKSL